MASPHEHEETSTTVRIMTLGLQVVQQVGVPVAILAALIYVIYVQFIPLNQRVIVIERELQAQENLLGLCIEHKLPKHPDVPP